MYEVTFRFDVKDDDGGDDDRAAMDAAIRLESELRLLANKLGASRLTVERVTKVMTTCLPFHGFVPRSERGTG
jgi:hypothetical protein